MYTKAWGIAILLVGVLCQAASAQDDRNLPYWSIIIICLACIVTLMMLVCLLCTICILVNPSMRRQNNWVRCYFPHLAFWWPGEEEASGNAG